MFAVFYFILYLDHSLFECIIIFFFNLYREVGTIIRSLNCCPSEAELHDMLAEVGIKIYIL